MERLILDTGVLIAFARKHLDLQDVGEESDASLPAVVVAEYLTGVEQDANPSRAASQRALLDRILTLLPVEEYTLDVARHHAELLATTRRHGKSRRPHDLIIAATASATGRTLMTTDTRARFAELPGVTSRVVEPSRG